MGTFIIIVVLLIFIAVPISVAVSSKAVEKKMKQKAAEIGATDFVYASYYDGLGIQKGSFAEIFLLPDRLLFQINNTQNFELKLSQIRAAENKSERELIEKGKSVVGRAVIGTLLVPGLGTIVGGMSGIGTKKKKGKENNFLIINYIDSQGDLTGITFLNNYNQFKIIKFCHKVNSTLPSVVSGTPIQL